MLNLLALIGCLILLMRLLIFLLSIPVAIVLFPIILAARILWFLLLPVRWVCRKSN